MNKGGQEPLWTVRQAMGKALWTKEEVAMETAAMIASGILAKDIIVSNRIVTKIKMSISIDE